MNLLVVDDEKNIRESLKILLKQEGFNVDCAENGLSGQRLLKNKEYDAGIFDLKMPGLTGLELLKWVSDSGIKLPVIMISAFGQISDAVQALKIGAEDYVVKPFDPEILIEKVHIMVKKATNENSFNRALTVEPSKDNFTSSSPIMLKLEERIQRIAMSRSVVLITGESGVGKEVAARKIHTLGSTPDSPFIALNMGGISESLSESELFGYEKGAFTGANNQKKGLLEQAEDGSLFLDEIGEMPPALQVKLLRVLQEKQFRRLGGIKNIEIKSRLITATNRDLEKMVKDGQFREDLFYRLNIARLNLPPLRDRREDIPGLIGVLISKLNRKMNLTIKTLSSESWEILENYTFPGNIRELENILERAMIFTEGSEITSENLELPILLDKIVENTKTTRNSKTLKEHEQESITEALHRWEGNRSRAAEELGISRRTIINKIKEYNLN